MLNKDEFIKPWMRKCNSDLILRYWRHKSSPGKLTLNRVYGFNLTYINTCLGELCIKQIDLFDQIFRNQTVK